MARDIRAYVDEVKALAKEQGLSVVEGGSVDEELRGAVAFADEIDPMTAWRKDMEKAKAVQAGEPCPECGERHGAVPDDGSPGPAGTPDEAQEETAGQPAE